VGNFLTEVTISFSTRTPLHGVSQLVSISDAQGRLYNGVIKKMLLTSGLHHVVSTVLSHVITLIITEGI